MGESENLRRLRRALSDVSERALQSIREGRGLSQGEVAGEVGITVKHLQDLEHGRRDLNAKVAKDLGRALGMEPEHLMAASIVGDVKYMAMKASEELSPHVLVEVIDYLERSLPETDLKETLLGALLELAAERIEAYKQERAAGRAALKSAEGEPTRDGFGRRLRKPHGLRGPR